MTDRESCRKDGKCSDKKLKEVSERQKSGASIGIQLQRAYKELLRELVSIIRGGDEVVLIYIYTAYRPQWYLKE